MERVLIPLEQGSVLRPSERSPNWCPKPVLIPLEQGSVLRPSIININGETYYVLIPLEQGSVLRQNSIMNMDMETCPNPFGTGQCLTTAVGSSSLVRQGLPKPLPNFFRDSESWVLIWLNVEQILTFHLHIKRSKT